ncbi:MAG: hypothetical protein NT020_14500, partial [Chloroflexales bacterium]|nr:hypothetical protein [Chloroflexales bacterium]
GLLIIIGTFFNFLLGFVLYKYYKSITIFISDAIAPIPQMPLSIQRIWEVIRRNGSWLYQRPVLVYSVVMLAWFAPFFISNQVLLPFRTFMYANLEPAQQSIYTETTFFSDYLSFYIPEVNLQLQVPRSGWHGLWTNSLEFGRPISQGGGFSPAYVITWMLMGVIRDPYIYFTIFFVVLGYLAGLFGVLYAHDVSGDPGVGLLTGLFLAFTPSFFFWNTFPMFIAATTWGMALFYGLHRIRHQPTSRLSILLVGFAVYSLVYTAYPQLIIHFAYLCIGYFCWQVWQLRTNSSALWRYIGACCVAVGLGGMLSLPLLLDLNTSTQLSLLRQQITPEFFISNVPNITTIAQLLTSLFSFGLSDILQPITTFTKLLFPIKSGYITFSLLIFVCIGISTQWRQAWGWVLWLLFAVAFSFRQDIFAFGYFYGLPQLSRGVLFGGSSQQIPLLILALYGLQCIFTRPPAQTRLMAFVTAGAGLQYIGLTIAYARWQQIPIQWPFVGLELLFLAGITLAIMLPHHTWRTILLSCVLLCNAQFLLRPLLLTQPHANVITSSPTANAINASLPPDGLMAMITVKPTNRLEPNFSSVLNIHQIGTYSSLQSKYYVTLMKRFNVKYDRYIRTVRSINPPLPANDLWMTNIRTIVSDKPLTIAGLTFFKRVDGLYLYHTDDGMVCCLRVPASALRTNNTISTHLWIDNPQATTNQRLSKKEDYGDEFQLVFPTQAEDSVLVFNQQFHPDWVAQVQTPSRWQPTTTVVINDVYQAVRIPAGATALSFQFRPWIRWSIIANLFWVIIAGIGVISKIKHIRFAMTTTRINNKLV